MGSSQLNLQMTAVVAAAAAPSPAARAGALGYPPYSGPEHSAAIHDESARARIASEETRASSSAAERFRILRSHAQGGLGEVFLALDPDLDRQVALKELRASHAFDPVSQLRFLREAMITGRLEHPGIVPVYALGRHGDGRPFYAMRFIEGETLKQAIERFHAHETAPRSGPAPSCVPPAAAHRCRRMQRGRLRSQPRRRASGPEAGEYHARTIRRDTRGRLGHRQVAC